MLLSHILTSAFAGIAFKEVLMGLGSLNPKTLLEKGIDSAGIGRGIFPSSKLGRKLNFYYFWEKRWFFFAMVVGAGMLQMSLPNDLSQAGMIVMTMSVVATILFITEPVPLPTVALMIIVGQVVMLGLDSTQVAKSLMTDSVLFIMGSLMLAVAVVKQKLDKRIAWLIVRLTGTKTSNICFGIAAVSGLLASFVGEHTVAAMMLPVGITLITLTSDDPKKVRNLAAVLLFSICYG